MPGAKIVFFFFNASICKGVPGRVIILRLIIQHYSTIRNNFLFVVSYMSSILSIVATHQATNSLEPNMTLRFSMVFGYALWSHVYVHFFRVCVCVCVCVWVSISFSVASWTWFSCRCQRMGTTLSNGGCEPWQFGPIMTHQSPGSHSTWVLLFQ